MRVSGSGLVFAPSGLRSYIPTTRRRPFQVLPGGEAEVSSGSAQGRIGPRAQPGRGITAAGARSREGINPGSKAEVASGRDGVSDAARGGHDSCRSTKPGVNPGRRIWSTVIQGRRAGNENPNRKVGRIKYMIAK